MYRARLTIVMMVAALLAACATPEEATLPEPDTSAVTPAAGFPLCPDVTPPAAEGPGFYDADDGYNTVQRGVITIDTSGCSSTVTDLDSAENWLFQGTLDQSIVIRVKGFDGADPQVTLIDPTGVEITTDDDSGGGTNAMLEEFLPLDGVYTLRVVLFEPGTYTINVLTGAAEPQE